MIKRYYMFLFLICSCIVQGQVWQNIIDSLPWGDYNFHTTEIDTTSNTLYIGGSFGGVNNYISNSIIKFNGTSFDTLQSGIDDMYPGNGGTSVSCLQMYQNKLYVGGFFKKAGHNYCRNLARWNGTSWDAVNFNPSSSVSRMTVYNNELYVCGSFDTIGGIVSHGAAKFDGTNWYPLSFAQPQTFIQDIAVFQDTIYAQGSAALSGIGALAKWNGVKWVKWKTVTGDGFSVPFGITVIDTMIYVYGRFDDVGGTHCKGLSAYNGKYWYGLGSGVANSSWERIQNIQKVNGDLYITGLMDKIESVGSANFSISQYTGLARFDGLKWCIQSPTFANVTGGVVWYKNNLYCNGAFLKIGTDSMYGFVKWIGGNTTIACSSTITIYQSTLGLKEISISDNIKIYPNPATSILNIVDEQNELNNSVITITNGIGQTVMQLPFTNSLDVGELANGYYFLNITTQDHKVLHSKFVKE